MKIQKILLHLSLIEDVGPATIQHIIERLGIEQLAAVYNLDRHDFIAQIGVTPAMADKISAGLADHSMLEKELRLLEQNHIHFITRFCADYPSLLQEIYQPPAVLYLRGNLQLLQRPSLAIVGSRKADQYAKKVINFLMPDLITAGFTIVSGGALGADSFAHEAALVCSGSTIAVLGSGLLNPYPPHNKKLFGRIIEHSGLLISPFFLHAEPLPGNFPARNRIISGMSQGCLVVQADAKSGARITAQFALEQGRDVFAVPGHIDHPLSAGCHELLKQGAILVSSPQDILQHYAITPASIATPAQPIQEEIKFSHTSSIEKTCEKTPTFSSEKHQLIFETCKNKPHSLDMLLEETSLGLMELQTILFDLQIQAVLEQDLAGRWKIL